MYIGYCMFKSLISNQSHQTKKEGWIIFSAVVFLVHWLKYQKVVMYFSKMYYSLAFILALLKHAWILSQYYGILKSEKCYYFNGPSDLFIHYSHSQGV